MTPRRSFSDSTPLVDVGASTATRPLRSDCIAKAQILSVYPENRVASDDKQTDELMTDKEEVY